MRLYDYLRQASENPNLWWTLDSGAHLDLFEQLLGIAVDALDTAIRRGAEQDYVYSVENDIERWEALTGERWDEDE